MNRGYQIAVHVATGVKAGLAKEESFRSAGVSSSPA